MLPITELVDIPCLFKRLHELPGELAAARMSLVDLKMGLKQNETLLTADQAEALAPHQAEYFGLKNEAQRDLYRAQVYGATPGLQATGRRIEDLQQEIAVKQALLENLMDEMTSLRYTVRLIESVVLGEEHQEVAIHGIDRQIMEQIGECIHPCADRTCCPGPQPCDQGAPNPDDDDEDALPF
jgi:hypothetical protein